MRRQGDAQDLDTHDLNLLVPEGQYTVSASAPRYQDGQATVRVLAGGTVTAPLTLRRIESTNPKTAPTPTPEAPRLMFTLEDWLKFGWTRDGAAIKRTGGEFVLLPSELSRAVIQFNVQLLKGKRIEWVAGYRDDKNYILYQFEDTNFIRTQVVNGKHVNSVKVLHGAKRDDHNAFGLRMSPQAILAAIIKDQNWKTLDDWAPAGGVPAGKFGFHIPGKDQLALSDFRIMPN